MESSRQQDGGGAHENPRKLLRWTKAETMLLLSAKRKREDGLLMVSVAGSSSDKASDVNKWKRICESVRIHGVERDHVACKKRWFHLLSDFRKIQDWQRTAAFNSNFWLMQPQERRENRLPSGFDKDIYVELDAWLGGVRPVMDSSPPILESAVGMGSGEGNLDFDVENDSLPDMGDRNDSTRQYFYTETKHAANKRQRLSTGKSFPMQDHSVSRNHVDMRESLLHIMEKNGKNMEIALRDNCQAQIDAQKQISQAQVDAQEKIIELQTQQAREFVSAVYALVGVLGELAKSLRPTANGT